MATKFELSAETRADQGKGASRRLRHAGKVPGIIYGGNETPANISLSHQKLEQVVDNEKFYATIVTVDVNGAKQSVVVKDVQMHPARNAIVHIDFQRVLADQPIRLHVPIHFLNEATSPGVKLQGGIVSHTRSDVEVSCLPKDLPEFIEVDMGQMKLNDSVKLSDLKLPAGVTIPELAHGHDAPVVAIHAPRVEAEEAPAAAEGAAAADAKAAPAATAAPAKK
jgi:large subunit ribosomal protein L25